MLYETQVVNFILALNHFNY